VKIGELLQAKENGLINDQEFHAEVEKLHKKLLS
jgi:hypothetical protein